MFNYSQSLYPQSPLLLNSGTNSHLDTTILVSHTSQPSELNQEAKVGFDELAVGSVGLLFILGILYLALRKRQPNPVILTPVYTAEDMPIRGSGIPCRHCRYFHPNLHLQCAVHPDIVLKRQAAQCKDFQCRNNKDVAA